MNAPQPISPRRRLQELLAIPDSQRSEAEWDELNELEIMLAPGNRAGPPEQGGGGTGGGRGGGGQNAGGQHSGGRGPGGRNAGGQNAGGRNAGGRGPGARGPGGRNPGAQNAGGQNAGGQVASVQNAEAQPPATGEGGAPAQAKKPARKFHKRPPKPPAA